MLQLCTQGKAHNLHFPLNLFPSLLSPNCKQQGKSPIKIKQLSHTIRNPIFLSYFGVHKKARSFPLSLWDIEVNNPDQIHWPCKSRVQWNVQVFMINDATLTISVPSQQLRTEKLGWCLSTLFMINDANLTDIEFHKFHNPQVLVIPTKMHWKIL
jgi:hypothetical protein